MSGIKLKKPVAPCGINCLLCLAYQRDKNKCPGCTSTAEGKPYHCTVCSIKMCEHTYCYECSKYPCVRLKQLEKRYRIKYGMSLFDNFDFIKKKGIRAFVKAESIKWRCSTCGSLLCIHRESCQHCGNKNPYYPEK
jgi:hypothetical protein